MVHGQCLSVGVGGYLLGGGINFVGTSAKHGTGASNILEYEMVTATGDIVRIRQNNVTLITSPQEKVKCVHFRQIQIFHDLTDLI